MGGAFGSAYRYVTAGVKSLQLVLRSLSFWPPAFWLKFWVWRAEDLEVALGPLRYFIRCRRLHVKLTDLYMVTTCVVDRQYDGKPGFAIGEDDVVIDIGAHIGSFSVYAASKARRGRVLSFEPDAGSFRQLRKNLEANGLGNVTALQQAVAGQAGERTLYSAMLNSAENNFYWKNDSARVVSCTTLARVFEEHGLARCDFLKIDCEGAEYEILRNTPAETLRKVRRIGIEAHEGRFFGLTDPEARPQTLTALLREAGFTIEEWRENALHTFIWARRD